MRIPARRTSAARTWKSSEEDEGRNDASAPAATAAAATTEPAPPPSRSGPDVDQRGLAWSSWTIADYDRTQPWVHEGRGPAGTRRRPPVPLPITGGINIGDGNGITSGKETTVIGIERGGTGTEEVSHPRLWKGAVILNSLSCFFISSPISLSADVLLYFFPSSLTLAAYKSWSSTIFSSYYPQN